MFQNFFSYFFFTLGINQLCLEVREHKISNSILMIYSSLAYNQRKKIIPYLHNLYYINTPLTQSIQYLSYLQFQQLIHNLQIKIMSKYSTIDPLILQTLDINERRIQKMLCKLHGRPYVQKITRNSLKPTINKSQTIGTRQSYLPQIKRISVVNKKIADLQIAKKKIRSQSLVGINSHRSKSLVSQTQQIQKSIPTAKQAKQPITNSKVSQEKKKTNMGQEILQTHKTEQLLLDYDYFSRNKRQRNNKIGKAKSVEINPKDVYRIQIQTLVAQLTEIQDLAQAQKKMARLKKRYKHLYKFDKSYFSNLNSIDYEMLS